MINPTDKEHLKLIEDILEGSATESEVYTLAFKSVGYVTSKFTESKEILISAGENYKDLVKLDILEMKRESSKLLKEALDHLRQIRTMFNKYPVVKITIDNLYDLYYHMDMGYLTLSFNQMLLSKCKEDSDIKTYFFRNTKTKHIKIGKSVNPKERLKQVQGMAGAKLEIIAVINKDVEHILHMKFKKYQSHSEWFNDKDGLILQYALTNKNQ